MFGILRPYLVVPDNWHEWSDEQRTCILLHELAHVQRFDVATQSLGRLAAIIYWFNPLAWYALKQLRIERELACDDCVLMSGQRASDYARQLLHTLKQYRTERFALGVAIARSARLDQRLLAILDHNRCRLPMGTTTYFISALSAGGNGGHDQGRYHLPRHQSPQVPVNRRRARSRVMRASSKQLQTPMTRSSPDTSRGA